MSAKVIDMSKRRVAKPKRCPFDGTDSAKLEERKATKFPWRVVCFNCGNGTGYYGLPVLAMRAWNRRAYKESAA